MSTTFKASKPKFPGHFELKDLAVYSTRLKARDTKKYADLKPILLAEGRKPPPKTRTRGIQAGEDDFSEDEEYKGLGRMDQEYRMVIHDWSKTPIYHILTRGMDVAKSIIRFCNKTTLNKLAGDLRERREFEERTELRKRRQYALDRQRNPLLARDSDDSSEGMLHDNSAERVERMKELNEMSREDRIIEVIGNVLTETEVEW